MAIEQSSPPPGLQDDIPINEKEQGVLDVAAVSDDATSIRSEGGRSTRVPVRMKIFAVLMVSLIGFGSHWSSGVTGAMKSTLKKVSPRRRSVRDTSR